MPKQASKFLFARIVQSASRWASPVQNRTPESRYVEKNGFGHEEWNFNKNLLIGGYIHGYARIGEKTPRGEGFNIAFATYKNSRWHLAGFYLDCELMGKPFTTKKVIAQKKRDLKQLGMEVNSKSLDDPKMLPQWRVAPDNAILTKEDILIPEEVYDTKNRWMDKVIRLNSDTFSDLYDLYVSGSTDVPADEKSFPEGKEREVTHKIRERNPALTLEAKKRFKDEYGHLRCQICDFDFERVYGDLGKDYIEAHHTVPISTSKGEVKTNVTDLAMVCANCHRMLHRRRPWLKMEELAELLVKPCKPCEDED